MKRKFITFTKVLLASLILVGCDCSDNTYNIITSIGGAGDFRAINMATNDTLKVSSGIVISINGAIDKLSAKNDNIIKLVFEPAEEYSKYAFTTTFVTHDSTEIKNQNVYEYVVKNTKPGLYKISMSASYAQKDDNNDILITGGGSFYLDVKE